MAASRATWIGVAILMISVVVLLASAAQYYPFVSDDALISLRYASRLLNGHGLTWTNGQHVEGYSNLLWVLLVAGLGLFRIDLIVAARILGVLSVTTILWVLLTCARSERRPVTEQHAVDWLPGSVAVLFISLSAPIAVWMIGGLEQPLIGALIALSMPLMYCVLDPLTSESLRHRRLVQLSIVLGLLAITRPDGPLFAVAAVATFLLAGPQRPVARLAGALSMLWGPVVAYGGQLVFRYWYYGELVPNTALVKLTLTAVRRANGLAYLWGGLRALSPFSFLAIAAIAGLLVVSRTRGRALYLATLSLIWSAYVVIIGGDIFPAYRHLVPLVVVFAFALVELFREGAPWLRGRPWITAAIAAVLMIQFAWYGHDQYRQPQSQRAVTERWEWQCRDLGVLLKDAFSAQQPTVAVTAAGCLPYWSELPSLDMLGLNDYYLPRHPPADLGTGFIGHELGDGAYVMRQRPDIIVFSVGSGPSFRSGFELDKMPAFHERYVPVAVRVASMDTPALVYFDRYSDKVGITQSTSSITVPAFLLSSDRSVAYPGRGRALVTSVSRDEPVRLTFASSALSDWDVAIIGPHPDQVQAHLEQSAGAITIVLSTTQPVPVEVDSVMLRAPAASAMPQRGAAG